MQGWRQSRAELASPPTARALDVLELLAGAARQGLTLSEVAARVELPVATASAVLSALCARGWAVRDEPSKRYRPGPALAATAGRSAAEQPWLQAARGLARTLAADTGYGVSVAQRAGEALHVLAFEPGRGPHRIVAGERIPFVAPFGPVFAAWATPAVRRAWSGAAEALEEALAAVRARGYSIERVPPDLADAARAVTALREGPLSDGMRRSVERIVDDITREALLGDGSPITTVAVPLRDADGRLVASVGVHPFRDLPADEVAALGQQLTGGVATVRS